MTLRDHTTKTRYSGSPNQNHGLVAFLALYTSRTALPGISRSEHQSAFHQALCKSRLDPGLNAKPAGTEAFPHFGHVVPAMPNSLCDLCPCRWITNPRPSYRAPSSSRTMTGGCVPSWLKEPVTGGESFSDTSLWVCPAHPEIVTPRNKLREFL